MSDVALKIFEDLEVHTTIEEEIFYPRSTTPTRTSPRPSTRAMQEHHVVKLLMAEIKQMPDGSDEWVAKMTVLIENVEHHAEEEEEDMFPPLRNKIPDRRSRRWPTSSRPARPSSAPRCWPTRSTSPRRSCSTWPRTSRSPAARR